LFAGGSVRFPQRAGWLEEFTVELLAFPGRHDDQVDALTQGLAWGATDGAHFRRDSSITDIGTLATLEPSSPGAAARMRELIKVGPVSLQFIPCARAPGTEGTLRLPNTLPA
jgi:hypothetical protein